MAEQKRSLAQELESLQRDMQAAARAHKDDAPNAAGNVGTAAQNVAESGLNSALQRSAMEIERGRGLQAAAREPLITEAMEALENDLAKAAQIASNEAQKRKNGKQEASPEELLAELSDLRRAWQQQKPDALYERCNLYLLAGVWLKKRTGLPMPETVPQQAKADTHCRSRPRRPPVPTNECPGHADAGGVADRPPGRALCDRY